MLILEWVCVCVCVCVRERERERERFWVQQGVPYQRIASTFVVHCWTELFGILCCSLLLLAWWLLSQYDVFTILCCAMTPSATYRRSFYGAHVPTDPWWFVAWICLMRAKIANAVGGVMCTRATEKTLLWASLPTKPPASAWNDDSGCSLPATGTCSYAHRALCICHKVLMNMGYCYWVLSHVLLC